MPHFLIRFNKSRGQPGRGTLEHVWRVFEGQRERIVKHLQITVPVTDERTGDEWNIACDGALLIDRKTSTAIISPEGSDLQTENSDVAAKG